MTKVTKQQKELMKELRSKGLSYKEIADKLNIKPNIVQYHLNEESRIKSIDRCKKNYKKLSSEEKKKLTKKRVPYMREYLNKRYKTDEEFREKHKERCNKYYHLKYSTDKEFRIKEGVRNKKRYSNRTERRSKIK